MARLWLYQDQTCPNCGGNKSCTAGCSNGKVDSGAVDIKGKAIMIDCSTCNGRGTCNTCSGKGTVSIRVPADE